MMYLLQCIFISIKLFHQLHQMPQRYKRLLPKGHEAKAPITSTKAMKSKSAMKAMKSKSAMTAMKSTTHTKAITAKSATPVSAVPAAVPTVADGGAIASTAAEEETPGGEAAAPVASGLVAVADGVRPGETKNAYCSRRSWRAKQAALKAGNSHEEANAAGRAAYGEARRDWEGNDIS